VGIIGQEGNNKVEKGCQSEKLIDVSGECDVGRPSLIARDSTTERKERVDVMQKAGGSSTMTG
jgi:hypothetical protein